MVRKAPFFLSITVEKRGVRANLHSSLEDLNN